MTRVWTPGDINEFLNQLILNPALSLNLIFWINLIILLFKPLVARNVSSVTI